MPHDDDHDHGDERSVGDLAAAAGTTVRALHHYEAVGLLRPSGRTAAGHRRYGPEAVARLYQVTLLRRAGLSLDQIGQALDDPGWGLEGALRRHAAALDAEVARLGALHAAVAAALADLDGDTDPTHDLLEALHAMDAIDTPIRRRISILVYRDLPTAHRHLVDVFGFVPGELTLDPDGNAVHGEVYAGDGVIWLHPETDAYGLASPATVGAATATMAVMVDDVDAHHAAVVERGGSVVYEPVDQPYGYREYGARDLEGTLWSFMKPLAPAGTPAGPGR